MQNKLHVYNSLSRKKELFEPINPPFVGLYTCGPTVYSDVQIGNMRTFISFDIIFRYLLHLGYKVRYVRNITDVGHLVDDVDEGEDKIERMAKLQKIEPMEVVQKYSNSFHDVTRIFNLLPPSIEPTATGHIIEQIEMVKKIIDNGYGYVVNGSVYFDVKKYMETHEYGELSGRKVEQLYEHTREGLEGGTEKRFFADFAIWKAASPETIMKWSSPWGTGVPGWHLECSVMSTKYLGEQFDIHGGGMDLKFPHHECEIAQNAIATGKSAVRYWLHGNMLNMNGAKMGKSKGNAILPGQLFSGDHPLLDRGYSPMVVKFFMLQAHYRSTLDFSLEALDSAHKGFKKLMDAYSLLKALNPSKSPVASDDKQVLDLIENAFEEMNDDFNWPKVVANLFKLVNLTNKAKSGDIHLSGETLTRLLETFRVFIEDIFGILEEEDDSTNDKFDQVMNLVVELRDEAKANKNWAASDHIRNKLEELGFSLKDSKEGTTWEANS